MYSTKNICNIPSTSCWCLPENLYIFWGPKMKNLSSCWAKDMLYYSWIWLRCPFKDVEWPTKHNIIYEPNFSTLTSHRDWYLKELKVQLVLVSGKYMTMIHLKNRTMMHLNKNSIHNYGIKVKINDIWFWAKTYNIN